MLVYQRVNYSYRDPHKTGFQMPNPSDGLRGCRQKSQLLIDRVNHALDIPGDIAAGRYLRICHELEVNPATFGQNPNIITVGFIYVYMYIIYVYMYICILYMYICICIYVYMYICIYVYMYICIYIYVYMYI